MPHAVSQRTKSQIEVGDEEGSAGILKPCTQNRTNPGFGRPWRTADLDSLARLTARTQFFGDRRWRDRSAESIRLMSAMSSRADSPSWKMSVMLRHGQLPSTLRIGFTKQSDGSDGAGSSRVGRSPLACWPQPLEGRWRCGSFSVAARALCLQRYVRRSIWIAVSSNLCLVTIPPPGRKAAVPSR